MSGSEMPFQHALLCTESFWPEFKEVEGFVFFAWAAPEQVHARAWHGYS